jgi:hypothetical protein
VKFRKKTLLVDAVQLAPAAAAAMVLMDALIAGDGCEHCYVDADGAVTADEGEGSRVGLQIPTEDPDVVSLAVEGDWVVRDVDGTLAVFSDERFQEQFEPAEDPNRRESVEFKPDWKKYPNLSAAQRGLAVLGVSDELRALLVDARADAAQYVHDVRVDELAKARADERRRIADRERQLGAALRQVLVRAKVLNSMAGEADVADLLAIADAYAKGQL